MKHPEHERLLNEIVTGEELADFREASLQHALAAVRRRRRRQWFARLGALAVVPLLAALGILVSRSPKPPLREMAASNASPVAVTAAQPRTAPVKFISDDELLALFPDRPVALIGKPGQQQLVFLDQPAKRRGGQF
jgi:peptidoglycan/LPS O-acetylase OafA/YrhL